MGHFFSEIRSIELEVLAMKTVCLTLCSIFLIGSIIAWVRSEPESPLQILNDFESEIEVVVCSATSARNSSLRNAELVSNIVNGLSPKTHVLVLVNDRKAFQTRNPSERVTFIEVPPQKSISIWPQDPFVVVQSQSETQLVVPCTFDREDDQVMPTALGDRLGIEVVHSELYFEGGDLVCDEEAVFTGMNTLQYNMELLQETSQSIAARFEKTFGRPLIVVGKEQPSIAHIDLIVTPLGRGVIAVADSRPAASLVSQIRTTSPEEIQTFEQHCGKMFFGREDIVQIKNLSGNLIARPSLEHETHTAIQASLEIAQELDDIASDFATRGYEVVRIPALIPDLKPELNSAGEEMPGYPMLTYNNVLLEERDGETIVYLPQYGLPALDVAAAKCWKELGYQVKTIPGFATSSMYGGSLRCCTKVLIRGAKKNPSDRSE